MYSALLTPPPALMFSDQYAFRPTGSTTAVLVFLLQTITNLLAEQLYVVVIALDFSKAFDTVRHSVVAPGVTPTGGHRSPTGGLR